MAELSAARIFRVAKSVLTAREYDAFDMRFRLGWSYGKIATEQGCDRSTAQRRVARARDKVNAEFKEAA